MAATFLLLLRVAVFKSGKNNSIEDWIDFFGRITRKMVENNVEQKTKKWPVNIISIKVYYFNIFIPPFFYLFLGGTHVRLHAKSKYKQAKIHLWLQHKGRYADSGGKWRTFHSFFPWYDMSTPSLDRKQTDLIRQKLTSKCLFPFRHILYRYILISLIGNVEK